MGRKKIPGLQKKNGIWHIDKQIFGRRVCQSTGTGDLEEAEKYLAHCIEQIRQATVYGVRPDRTFREAAAKFLMENQHKRSIMDDVHRLKKLMFYIGDLPLKSIHMGALQTFIDARREEGVKTRTINHGLKVVRRILNLAAQSWIDENGMSWLAIAPKISMLPEHDLRPPHPLSWDEQEKLFDELPEHLRLMAEFAVNTGCRASEICSLRWEWEAKIPELNTSVFIIPKEIVKNEEDRLVVLNKAAFSVIGQVRRQHPEYVFTYKGKPKVRIFGNGWINAREKVGLDVRVHDLKHTFGRRLRAAGVSFEDRQDLLGHKSGRITTHYSAPEIQNLIYAANKVCEKSDSRVTLTLLKGGKIQESRKSHERNFDHVVKIALGM